MNVLVAMEAFAGALDSVEACAAVRRGLLPARPDCSVEMRPMADGGQGTARALLASRGGAWIPVRVRGPLPGQEIEAGMAWLPRDKTAFIECAAAAGLALAPRDRRDLLGATSYGVGELIAEAAQLGAQKLLVGAGATMSTDGGIGMAAALGYRFLDADGKDVELCALGLGRIATIAPPASLDLPPMQVLHHVDNPLLGPNGAARALAPRKGADAEQVEVCEAGLRRLAELTRRQLGREAADLPGSGAAGGLAFGAAAFLGATLAPGARAILATMRLPEEMPRFDFVLVGGPRLTADELKNKPAGLVARIARALGKPAAAIVGGVEIGAAAWREAGISSVTQISPEGWSTAELERAIADAAADFGRKRLPPSD